MTKAQGNDQKLSQGFQEERTSGRRHSGLTVVVPGSVPSGSGLKFSVRGYVNLDYDVVPLLSFLFLCVKSVVPRIDVMTIVVNQRTINSLPIRLYHLIVHGCLSPLVNFIRLGSVTGVPSDGPYRTSRSKRGTSHLCKHMLPFAILTEFFSTEAPNNLRK